MSAQSYIKFWTANLEHEEVQAYDLLGYEYDSGKKPLLTER